MSRKADKGLTKHGKKRERVPAIPGEARAFAFGLIMGVAGESYRPATIARMVNERFGYNLSPKTISNWKYDLPSEMKKHDITEGYIKEVIARCLLGDQRTRDEIKTDLREPEGKEIEKETPTELPLGEEEKPKLLTFSSVAEVISYCEKQGFIVGKDLEDIKHILAANNLRVMDESEEMLGLSDIFITPIELDIEVVGRNIVANPIIGFYYAYERRDDPKLDISVWITNKLVELYSNLDKIYPDRKPIVLAVLRG